MHSIKMLVGVLLTTFILGCSESTTEQNIQDELGGSRDEETESSSFGAVDASAISSDYSDASNGSHPSSGADSKSVDDEYTEDDESSAEESDSVEQSKSSNDQKDYRNGDTFTLPVFDGESTYIFDDDELRTYNILIDPEALERMNAVPQDEIYEFADLVFEGDTIQDVQVRYKGSTGAWYPCTNGENGSPWPPGPNSCLKLSTKVKFNTEADSERKFFGLKKLQFHHMHHYDSQLKERVVYWFHNAMGNPAPRSVHARVEINGKLSGLYALVEQIDGRFTRERWEDGEGNIYKNNTVLPDDQLSDDATLFEVLKTNEDEDPTYTIWQTFEEELDGAQDIEEIKSVIAKWMDVPLTVNTVVTSIAMGHWDSPFLRKEYTHHNAYWYSDTTEQKLYAIPWDVDNGLISLSGRKGETSKGHMSVEDVAQAFGCNSPVQNKLQGHWLCFPDEVKVALDKLLDDVYPQIMPLLDKWEAQIEEVTQETIDTHGSSNEKGKGFPKAAISKEKWRAGVEDLREALEASKQIAEDWRSGL
ncbi:MAG: CotH kinase family protein [Fibrobacterales bacterium]